MDNNEINDCAKKVENLSLECAEIIEACSPISSLPDYVDWRDELRPDGRKQYLSINMSFDEFMYLQSVVCPEELIYLPDDIHMHGHYYQFCYQGRFRRIHMNSVCMGITEDWYDDVKLKLHGSHFCEWFGDPAMFVNYVRKYNQEMFCDACKCFIYEYDMFQYDPCTECVDNWAYFNRT
nr:hypothetical protein [Mute swan feces associated ambidensovirus 7]